MQLSPGLYSRMAAILDPVRSGVSAGSERRREPRQPVEGAGKLATLGAPVEAADFVQVQDVSLGGACLLGSRDLAVGEQLMLVLEGRDGSLSHSCARSPIAGRFRPTSTRSAPTSTGKAATAVSLR